MKNLINKIKNNKAFKITYGIIKAIVTVILLVVLAVIIIQRVSNNEISVGGYRIYTVITPSMYPEYRVGDILVSKETEPEEVKVGDNVVYLGEEDDFKDKIVTHKVISIRKDKETGKINFITKGLNNIIEDPEIDEDQLYGVVVYKTLFLSFISRIMTSMVGCFAIFAIVMLVVSVQIVINIFFDGDDEDDEEDNGKPQGDNSEEELEEI